MSGTVMPPPALPTLPLTFGAGQRMSASFANSFRVAAMADRLAEHVRVGGAANVTDIFGLCLSLARGIDYALANNEVPPNVITLPSTLKQVCKWKNALSLQAAIMVLMISVKNACHNGWFSEDESKELYTLANEIANSFCSTVGNSTLQSDSQSIITTVMSRFYPLMKLGQILASLEVKPGYGAHMVDFHIAKNMPHSADEKIRLFVAQRDNIETSACIISPQQVNFLLNGRGVEKRTNVLMDTGPQMPTNVTAMLKYGTNLLQAVGQFNGNYIIAIAFASEVPLPETSVLPDYVPSNVITTDPDSDIIEGPSRVSLNCPISFSRIRTPTKGHSCRHLQCFDFSNFMKINSRRPSWRCPHCNQHVCYSDIRVDQNMAKVLKEVGANVVDVIISADGSWKAVLESDENMDHSVKETVNRQPETSEQQEPATCSVPNVFDLTEEDDRMEAVTAFEIEDRKPFQATSQSQSLASNLAVPLFDQNVSDPLMDELLSSYVDQGSGASAAGLNMPMVNSFSEPSLGHSFASYGSNALPSLTQTQFSSGSLQQSQIGNTAVNNEYGRLANVSRQVNRTPVAVQAFPVTSAQQQRPRANLNSNPIGLSPTLPNDFSAASNPIDRYRQAPHTNALPALDRALSPRQPQPVSQFSSHQIQRDPYQIQRDRLFYSAQVSGPPTSQRPDSFRSPPGFRTESPNLHQLQQIHRMPPPHTRSPSPVVAQSSSPLPRVQTPQGGPQVSTGIQQSRFASPTPRPVQVTRQPQTVPVVMQPSRVSLSSNTDRTRAPAVMQRGNVGGVVTPVNTSVDSSEPNWRPTQRMRGSLSGQAMAGLGDLIIRPSTQTTQSQQQPVASTPSSISPQIQAFLANGGNFYASPTQNSPTTQPASTNGNAGSQP